MLRRVGVVAALLTVLGGVAPPRTAAGIAGTAIHTVDMDAAWVEAHVPRTSVPAGATREGEAFAQALKTDVRAALGQRAEEGAGAVGLRIRIDADSLPTVSVYRRIVFRRMRVVSGVRIPARVRAHAMTRQVMKAALLSHIWRLLGIKVMDHADSSLG